MKMKFIKRVPLLLILCLATGLALVSCGGEEEPAGELDKAKFIGDYVGEFKCANPLIANAVDDPSFAFNISDTSPAQDDQIQINLDQLEIPFLLIGTVSGNTVSLQETTAEDIMLTNPLPITIDVTATGTATLAGNALNATIDLIGKTKDGAELARDKCTITANRQ